MFKFKKMIAVLTAGALLLAPITANAAFTGGEVEKAVRDGNLTIEHDDSVDPTYCNIVLPTLTIKTYEFVMDPELIMDEYDSDFDGESSLYFLATTEPLSVTNTIGDKKLYVEQYNSITLSDFNNRIEVTNKAISDVTPGTYYLWVPASAATKGYTGGGEYTSITIANAKDYFVPGNTDGTVKFAPRSGNAVSSQVVYSRSFADVSTIADFDFEKDVKVTGTENKTVTLADGLFYKTGALYEEYGTTKLAGLEYNMPAPRFVEASDVAKIVNKATVDTAVTVKTVLDNVGGLRFNSDALFDGVASGSNESNMIYLAVNGTITGNANASKMSDDGVTTEALFQSPSANSTVTSATIAFTLKGASQTQAISYQTDEVDLITGDHANYRYEAPTVVYDAAEFSLTGATNYGDSEPAWDSYLESLTARPTIDIIFKMVNTIDEHVTVVVPTVSLGATIGLIKLGDPNGDFGFTTVKSDYKVIVTKGDNTTAEVPVANTVYEILPNTIGGVNFKLPPFVDSWKKVEITFDGVTYEITKEGDAASTNGELAITTV